MRFFKPALVLACSGVLVACYAFLRAAGEHHDHGHDLSALEQTVQALEPGAPLRLPPLLGTDGKPVAPGALQGRWSMVFLGFTSCPDVCPTTLHLLSAVARDPASGVAAGAAQILFVSVDPQRDTPAHLRTYLESFGGVTGLTGSAADIARFVTDLGGAYGVSGASLDHSTSIFVLDAQGRPAGVLLRPADPARIVADFALLRASGS
jgi:protein SCO1/2